jgi:hypothetical protein
MKKKIKKIYLPKWQRYFIVPFFVLVWLIVLYQEFFSAEAGQLGSVGFVLMTIVFLGVALMIWFMTTGKLPAYIMEEEVEDDEKDSASQ